ncbi:MAG: SDR family NAD(P)-dependent oxidoreductase, partial [Burkholderiaceae bacterium]|nr:SDR family NAD(P)-dependent oxidoreductase [Burkholderiaceae bacterium]
QARLVAWRERIRVIHVPAGPARHVPKERMLPYMNAFARFVTRFARRERQRYDVVHANFFMSGMVAQQVKRALGVPYVITFHAPGQVRRLARGAADAFPPERYAIELDTNLNGPFLLAKYAAEHMRGVGAGHIVNIASTAAKRAWPNAAAYHASKWGLLGLSHALHAELRPHRIKVTAVIAGGMRAPFPLDRFPDIDLTTLQEPMNVAQPVKSVLLLPDASVVAEITVLPLGETSWP